MTFETRKLTQEDLEKIQAYHRGEIQKPQWIIDWEKKLEEAELLVAAAMQSGTLPPEHAEHYKQSVVQMMFRRDRLYNIWFEELPFKTWDELATERPPSADDLFRYTVEDTEDYLNGPSVSAFVFFLEQKWKGFFKDFTHQCLRECDPLLEEAVKLTPEVRRRLSYPEQAFNTTNKKVLGARLLEWFGKTVPKEAPGYVQRLLIANVMVALGNNMGACKQMEFARCEAASPNFSELMERKDPQGDIFLTQAQRWQIDILLTLWPS